MADYRVKLLFGNRFGFQTFDELPKVGQPLSAYVFRYWNLTLEDPKDAAHMIVTKMERLPSEDHLFVAHVHIGACLQNSGKDYYTFEGTTYSYDPDMFEELICTKGSVVEMVGYGELLVS